MTKSIALRAPCGKYRNSRNREFTQQSLHDHMMNCATCNKDHVWFDERDFIGNENNPIHDMDMSDESDGVYLATASWLNGDW